MLKYALQYEKKKKRDNYETLVEIVWKQDVMVYFRALFGHLSVMTKFLKRISQQSQRVSQCSNSWIFATKTSIQDSRFLVPHRTAEISNVMQKRSLLHHEFR
jgi:hypothetical protein